MTEEKQKRTEAIRRIITEEVISTQGDLTDRLRAEGFSVTQATVSRDMREMQIRKAQDGTGRYFVDENHPVTPRESKFRTILREAAAHTDYAENLAVLKTYSGMAQAAAAAIDAMEFPDVVGTVAGDDTVLVILRSRRAAEQFLATCAELMR